MNDNVEPTTSRDNLAEMVRDMPSDTIPPIAEVPHLDVVEDRPIEDVVQNNEIKITSLLNWFRKNNDCFDNVKPVNVAIQDGDPNNLILSVENIEGKKNEAGNIIRLIQGFENANEIIVLDYPAMQMNIFKNNNFQILYNSPITGTFIKCYSVNTGLIMTFCIIINNLLIPYKINRAKKKDTEIEIPANDNSQLREKLLEKADLEALQLLYKQTSKVSDQLTTVEDVLNWLISRQNEIVDINHLLQIDNLIIDIMKS